MSSDTRALFLESLREPVVFVHCYLRPSRSVIALTIQSGSMKHARVPGEDKERTRCSLPNKYPRDYVDACRRRVDLQISSYQGLEAAAGAASFEHQFFNNMVLVLDYLFVHRTRTLELKDGNPLNEVRLICNSLLQNDGLMGKDNSIELDPAKSVLGLHVGDGILLDEAGFRRLSEAFFAELERKFM